MHVSGSEKGRPYLHANTQESVLTGHIIPDIKDYPPHSHAGLTTHVILRGQLTIAYPEDEDPEQRSRKTTYGVGDRIDVEAGRVHEVWMGAEGCTYVIGE